MKIVTAVGMKRPVLGGRCELNSTGLGSFLPPSSKECPTKHSTECCTGKTAAARRAVEAWTSRSANTLMKAKSSKHLDSTQERLGHHSAVEQEFCEESVVTSKPTFTRRDIASCGIFLATTIPMQSMAWTYEEEWDGMCRQGAKQSPIDLPAFEDEQIETVPYHVQIRYPRKVVGVKCINNHHGSPQLNYPAGIECLFRQKSYFLKQIHFHTPSEHALQAHFADMEMHSVHQSEDGDLLVLAHFMKSGSRVKNSLLETALQHASEYEHAPEDGVECQVDMGDVLDLNQRWLYYVGSLTTPPCSEDVTWLLSSKTLRVSEHQVLRMQRFRSQGASLSLNARKLQPLHGRRVQLVE